MSATTRHACHRSRLPGVLIAERCFGRHPVQIIVNGALREVAATITVADLLKSLDLRPQQVAVEVNRKLVPRTRHESHVLKAGDCVEIVTLVGGG